MPSGMTNATEVQRHRHDRLGDPVVTSRRDVGHERAVDLQPVDAEAAQVRQRRVAGAEVVDGQLEPQTLQLVEDEVVLVGVAEDALGELDDQRLRVESRQRQRGLHPQHQPRVAELAYRQVHAQAELALTEQQLPLRNLVRRLQQHRLADPADQTGALGDGDEVVRGDVATLAVRQPSQRLDAP